MVVSVWAAASMPENLRVGLAGWQEPGLEESLPTASDAPLLGPVRWGSYPALRTTQFR